MSLLKVPAITSALFPLCSPTAKRASYLCYLVDSAAYATIVDPAVPFTYRLLTSAFIHVDATHLITNLTAAIPDCVDLEQQCGAAALVADLAMITLTSHVLYGKKW